MLLSTYDRVAQTVEHLTFNQGVGRSNRPTVTRTPIGIAYREDIGRRGAYLNDK